MIMSHNTLKSLSQMLRAVSSTNKTDMFKAIAQTELKPLVHPPLAEVKVIVGYLLTQSSIMIRKHDDLLDRFFNELEQVPQADQAVIYLARVYDNFACEQELKPLEKAEDHPDPRP